MNMLVIFKTHGDISIKKQNKKSARKKISISDDILYMTEIFVFLSYLYNLSV